MVCFSNDIENEGAIAFADALEKNSTIKVLTFRNNGIGIKGATSLANALAKNTTLKSLSLIDS